MKGTHFSFSGELCLSPRAVVEVRPQLGGDAPRWFLTTVTTVNTRLTLVQLGILYQINEKARPTTL